MESFNSGIYWLFGHYLGRDIYNSTYFTVENQQGPIYLIVPDILNFISFSLTILSVCLVATKSQQEKFYYRMSIIMSHIILFLTCFIWGTLMKPEFFFPVFAFSCRGYLNFIRCEHLWSIWIVSFGFGAASIFVSVLIRMSLVARKNGPYDFSKKTYLILAIIYITFFPTIDIILWYICAYAGDDAYVVLLKNYPTTVKYLDFNITIAFDYDFPLTVFVIFFASQFISYFIIYIKVCFVITIEIKKQSALISIHSINYHKRALKEGIVQSMVITIFLVFSPYIMFAHVFAKSNSDTRIASIISNSIFTSSPIPNIITMMFLKRTLYMKLFRYFMKSKSPCIQKSSAAVMVRCSQL